MPGANLLATMFTTTTFGTWLPGDLRGYVDRGVIFPANPQRLVAARRMMRDRPVYLTADERDTAFDALVHAAREFDYRLLAVSIESWHVHWLVAHGFDKPAAVAGRLKTRMRQAVDRGRIWTDGYDKRYCFDEMSMTHRRDYINRHPGARPLHLH